MKERLIPLRSKVVWTVEAVLFAFALLWQGDAAVIWAAAALAWFGVFEARGVASAAHGDTLSESVWSLLDVENKRVGNVALYFLVMGLFCAAGTLFVGIVAELADWEGGYNAVRPAAASMVALGTIAFLARHFWRGDSR